MPPTAARRFRTLVLTLAGLTACAPPPPTGVVLRSSGLPVLEDGATALPVSVADFQRLRWVEGRWHAERADGTHSYEGWRFVNDSTIRGFVFADSLSREEREAGGIVLRNGFAIAGSGEGRWAVTELSEGRVQFAPARGVRTTMTWERASPDAWVATVRWPATPDTQATEIRVEMRRLPP